MAKKLSIQRVDFRNNKGSGKTLYLGSASVSQPITKSLVPLVSLTSLSHLSYLFLRLLFLHCIFHLYSIYLSMFSTSCCFILFSLYSTLTLHLLNVLCSSLLSSYANINYSCPYFLIFFCFFLYEVFSFTYSSYLKHLRDNRGDGRQYL